MVLRAIRWAVLVGAVAAVLMVIGAVQAWGGETHTTPDLFYNYYVGPGQCGGPGAALYVSPLPTPPYVGHTYITYQPLMPHEFLYHHQRSYLTTHSNGTATKTNVRWR